MDTVFVCQVSISQSRCLSFQDNERSHIFSAREGFNLAIEMLVISGSDSCWRCVWGCPVSISQSRCLSFQDERRNANSVRGIAFQSRNRDACHFRSGQIAQIPFPLFSFNLAIEMLVISGQIKRLLLFRLRFRFNLAIEMLVISGRHTPTCSSPPSPYPFQSRNRDACHFRGLFPFRQPLGASGVSISQSRCLSFQGRACGAPDTPRLNTRTSASVHFQHDGAC